MTTSRLKVMEVTLDEMSKKIEEEKKIENEISDDEIIIKKEEKSIVEKICNEFWISINYMKKSIYCCIQKNEKYKE